MKNKRTFKEGGVSIETLVSMVLSKNLDEVIGSGAKITYKFQFLYQIIRILIK